MKHSVGELKNIVYQYYTRGMPNEDRRNETTEEYKRLSAARRQAGANNEPWRNLLARASAQFHECKISNGSLHLPTGSWDAGYCGELFLPEALGEQFHTIGFVISFLVPYYVIYSTRTVDDPEWKPHPDAAKYEHIYYHDTMYVVPIGWRSRLLTKAILLLNRIDRLRRPSQAKDERFTAGERKRLTPIRRELRTDLSTEEQRYATWLAREIEANWGYERMPPEIGNVIVPDVATNHRRLGEATIYDCLFLDSR